MRIIGTGSAVPDFIVKNEAFETFLDTSDEWITTRTGIHERRIHEGNLEQLAAIAAKRALEDAGLLPCDIDFIICSNVYSRFMTPALSCVVQGLIGAGCPCLDINGACAGFIYALEMANAYLKHGSYKNILVLSAEEPSRMADWTDRSTCVLFGDAAAAAVVNSGGFDCLFSMHTESNVDFLHAYNSPGNCPFERTGRKHEAVYMNGREVYKFAVNAATNDITALCSNAGVELCKVDWFILHQANLRILDAVRARLTQPKEKFPHNMERFGNTSSAGVPLMLDQLNREGALNRGDVIAMSAFGAGLTTGACLMRW